MLSGDPAGVFKHQSFINGCEFADARMRLDMYPPHPRFRREYAPFMHDVRCVPAGSPKIQTNPKPHLLTDCAKGLEHTFQRCGPLQI